MKKKNENKDKYLDLDRELTKLSNMKVTVIPIVIGALGTVNKRLVQGLENLEIRRPVETVLNYSILEIGQNIEKRPGDLRRLAVTQTPVKTHSANAGGKNSRRNNNNINNGRGVANQGENQAY